MVLTEELTETWKEVAVAAFRALFRNFRGRAEEETVKIVMTAVCGQRSSHMYHESQSHVPL
jgi:hypothetical protein